MNNINDIIRSATDKFFDEEIHKFEKNTQEKIRTCRWYISKSHKILIDITERVIRHLNSIGLYDLEFGNDAPRGGKSGCFIKVASLKGMRAKKLDVIFSDVDNSKANQIFINEAQEITEMHISIFITKNELVKILEDYFKEYSDSCDYDGNIIIDDDLVERFELLIKSVKEDDITPYKEKYDRIEVERQKKKEKNKMKRLRKKLRREEKLKKSNGILTQ